MKFLTDNLGTIIVTLIVLVIVSLIIIKMIKDKKHGKSSCGCDCKNCPNSPYCHSSKK